MSKLGSCVCSIRILVLIVLWCEKSFVQEIYDNGAEQNQGKIACIGLEIVNIDLDVADVISKGIAKPKIDVDRD